MDNAALYRLGYGLYVLTARDGEKDNGCIVNTLMQVSSNPMTAVLGVNKQNLTHDMILKTGVCNVSMLTTAAPFSVFQHFGFQSGRTVNKFENCPTEARAENGVLYIPKYTNAYLSLRVLEAMDFSTHTLFKTEIADARLLGDGESVTYAYYQASIKPRPQPAKKTGWRCNVCGYVYEGETLPPDFICPVCKHGAADFTKITVE